MMFSKKTMSILGLEKLLVEAQAEQECIQQFC